MKTTLLAIAACLALAVTGCVQNKQILHKSTVFGFQATTPELSYGSVTVQFGLIRSEYWSNPTSTNPVYAGPFNSAVNADLNIIHQKATENFGTK